MFPNIQKKDTLLQGLLLASPPTGGQNHLVPHIIPLASKMRLKTPES